MDSRLSRSETLQLPINLDLLENILADTLYDVESNYYSQTSRKSTIGQNNYNRVKRYALRELRVKRYALRGLRVKRYALRGLRVKRYALRGLRVKRYALRGLRVKRYALRQSALCVTRYANPRETLRLTLTEGGC